MIWVRSRAWSRPTRQRPRLRRPLRGGAAGAGADLSAEPADATAGSVLHHAGVHAESRCARFGAQDVGISDIQVIARDGDVEIVLERQRDGVIQRQVELAVVHELVDARGIRKIRRRQVPRCVGPDRIGKMRHRLGIVQDRQWLAGAAAAWGPRAIPGPSTRGSALRKGWQRRRAGRSR